MIERIDVSVIFPGRQGGITWFHPRACMVPATPQPIAFMTQQPIFGSDVYGPVHWTESADGGATWSEPQPIPGFGRRTLPNGLEEGVCDVVPTYHPQTGTILAIGHNVYYRDNVLARPNEARFPVYAVRDAQGRWTPERRQLAWEDPRATAIYTCGCAQRVTLPNGDLIIPISLGPHGRDDRAVGSLLCSFDGDRLTVHMFGNELRLSVGRGLLEPSIIRLDEQFYMTIRAENGQGFVSTSEDGLHWRTMQPWMWDDGEPLAMSTTQQHWLAHSDGLYLVYTRRAAENVNVFRWRAPLYLAQVDRRTLRLIRATERVAIPMAGDGVRNAAHVARMGNFHVTNVSPHESWITVGETLPADGWRGNTLLARVCWAVPNRLPLW